jgi:antitoxin (DNA-binding transcriptional repressor) of toxin-antitoxin stability system
MQTIQVGQLKSEFSSVLEKVQNEGETFIIEFGKKHKKVAMLVPYKEDAKIKSLWTITRLIKYTRRF